MRAFAIHLVEPPARPASSQEFTRLDCSHCGLDLADSPIFVWSALQCNNRGEVIGYHSGFEPVFDLDDHGAHVAADHAVVCKHCDSPTRVESMVHCCPRRTDDPGDHYLMGGFKDIHDMSCRCGWKGSNHPRVIAALEARFRRQTSK